MMTFKPEGESMQDQINAALQAQQQHLRASLEGGYMFGYHGTAEEELGRLDEQIANLEKQKEEIKDRIFDTKRQLEMIDQYLKEQV